MTNALLNRFRRSMRVRDVFMQAITPLRFYSRTLRRTTTCTSIQCTGSLHRWTSILQTGGGCVFVQTLQYSLVYQKGEIPNIFVNEVKFPSNFCLAARVLTERLIKISLNPDSWNLLKAAQLDENMRFWEILCSLEIYSMCIHWSRMGSSWARCLRQKLF